MRHHAHDPAHAGAEGAFEFGHSLAIAEELKHLNFLGSIIKSIPGGALTLALVLATLKIVGGNKDDDNEQRELAAEMRRRWAGEDKATTVIAEIFGFDPARFAQLSEANWMAIFAAVSKASSEKRDDETFRRDYKLVGAVESMVLTMYNEILWLKAGSNFQYESVRETLSSIRDSLSRLERNQRNTRSEEAAKIFIANPPTGQVAVGFDRQRTYCCYTFVDGTECFPDPTGETSPSKRRELAAAASRLYSEVYEGEEYLGIGPDACESPAGLRQRLSWATGEESSDIADDRRPMFGALERCEGERARTVLMLYGSLQDSLEFESTKGEIAPRVCILWYLASLGAQVRDVDKLVAAYRAWKNDDCPEGLGRSGAFELLFAKVAAVATKHECEYIMFEVCVAEDGNLTDSTKSLVVLYQYYYELLIERFQHEPDENAWPKGWHQPYAIMLPYEGLPFGNVPSAPLLLCSIPIDPATSDEFATGFIQVDHAIRLFRKMYESYYTLEHDAKLHEERREQMEQNLLRIRDQVADGKVAVVPFSKLIQTFK